MRYPQVLIYESDRQLAQIFRREDEARARDQKPREWAVREPRSLESCLRLLAQGGPSVFLLKLGKDPVREFTILERVTWLYPDAAAVVVCTTDDPVLAGLAWDLGARFVLFSTVPLQQVVDISRGLLQPTAGNPSPAVEPAEADVAGPVEED